VAAFLIRRLLHALVAMFLITLATFAIINLAPGGLSILMNPNLTAEDLARFRQNLGLDDPLPIRYVRWVLALLRADFGTSFTDGQPVMHLIGERLPNTLLLAAVSLVAAVVIGVPVGILSATRPYSPLDVFATVVSFIGVSIPIFWLGLMFIVLFSVQLGWLPSAGLATPGMEHDPGDRLAHLLMPAAVLAFTNMPQLIRFTRSSLLEVLNQDYVRTARGKGLPERTVLVRHALRNALVPVVTVTGLLLPRLVGGAAITESVFAWPGMGRLAVEAAFKRDYPVIMGLTVIFAIAVILSNLIVDALYAYLNPRIELE
jgi:peptide/nickel transport system permease protein